MTNIYFHKVYSVINILLLLFLGFFSFPIEARADDSYFSPYSLAVEGRYIDYVVEDINNDGKNDLLFFHLRPNGSNISRMFSVFYQTGHGFSDIADQTFEIDKGAVVYFVSDVDPTPGKEILFFKSDGLFYYSASSNRIDPTPKLLIKTDSMFKLPDMFFMENYNCARDLNDDGIDEILVPQFGGFSVYARNDQHIYSLTSALDTPLQTTIISGKELSKYLVSSYIIPNMVLLDYNNDHKNDIVIIQETHIRVFFQNGNLVFSNEDAVTLDLSEKLTQAYALRIRNHNIHQRDRFKDRVGIRTLEDLNKDGLVDLIVEHFSVTESLFNPTITLKVHFGRPVSGNPGKGPVFSKNPDNIIVTTGFPGRSTAVDLNGDGTKELLVPSVELGLFKIIRIILSGEADVSVFVYKCSVSDIYGEEPDEDIHFSVDIDRRGRKIPVASFNGDFNGDGKTDHLGSKDDALILVFNPGDGSLKSTPDITFPVQIPENGLKVKPHYINDDKYGDVIIVYDETTDEIAEPGKNVCVLLNTNGNPN